MVVNEIVWCNDKPRGGDINPYLVCENAPAICFLFHPFYVVKQ